jgi:hypothetical protein
MMTVLYIRARFNTCVVVLPAKEVVLQIVAIGAVNLIGTVFNEYQKFEGEGSERINTFLSIIY